MIARRSDCSPKKMILGSSGFCVGRAQATKGLRNHVSMHVLRSAGRLSAVGQAVPDSFVAPSMHRDHPNEGSLRLSVLRSSLGLQERIRQAQPDLRRIPMSRSYRDNGSHRPAEGGRPTSSSDRPPPWPGLWVSCSSDSPCASSRYSPASNSAPISPRNRPAQHFGRRYLTRGSA